ncbi:MAG: type II secretion system F family protein [Euryarchaeota archaeon]|nr:type II secretion system F family protein [Euryarchaeota archaeon]
MAKKQNKTDMKRKEKKDSLKEIKTAYRSLDDRKKFVRSVFIPLIILGVLVMCLPFLLQLLVSSQLQYNPITFIFAGTIPIILGVFYPYISWKNRESDINGKMHFFITHIRVLAISDLSLKDIINVLGGNKAYKSLGEEIRKISVLADQWRVPISKTFRFVGERTPSKILRDFLDRFSQSLDSGVEHREFIEHEQDAVLQEYKTIYEASNENIVILSEVYVSLLISIIFVMSLGIVLPMVMGSQDMGSFIYVSSFMLLASEGMLLYLLRSMIPPDEMWHSTGEKGEIELSLLRTFKTTLIVSVLLCVVLSISKVYLSLPIISMIPIEILIVAGLTPLFIPGIKALREEEHMSRKERNFMGFLPALGSISTMRGGRINDSVYYLSEKDYGVLTTHIRDLYRRLRTRINDDAAWEWFGVDTGSNYIQRSCEMFRQATSAAANPRTVSRMIAENIRKIRDLRVKKLAIVRTTSALLGGITFGIAFSIYISFVVARHLNSILITSKAGNPFEGTTIDVGAILTTVPPEVFTQNFFLIFMVLLAHSFLMGLTIRSMRGSHFLVTFFYFIPFAWIVAVTSVAVDIGLRGYLGM